MVRFDSLGDQGLGEILDEQLYEANRQFSTFIMDEYENFIKESSDVITSPKILDKYVKPHLEEKRDVVFIVIDCLRVDQWKSLEKILYNLFAKMVIAAATNSRLAL